MRELVGEVVHRDRGGRGSRRPAGSRCRWRRRARSARGPRATERRRRRRSRWAGRTRSFPAGITASASSCGSSPRPAGCRRGRRARTRPGRSAAGRGPGTARAAGRRPRRNQRQPYSGPIEATAPSTGECAPQEVLDARLRRAVRIRRGRRRSRRARRAARGPGTPRATSASRLRSLAADDDPGQRQRDVRDRARQAAALREPLAGEPANRCSAHRVASRPFVHPA